MTFQTGNKKLDWANCKLQDIGILTNFNRYFNKSKSSVSGKLLVLDSQIHCITSDKRYLSYCKNMCHIIH